MDILTLDMGPSNSVVGLHANKFGQGLSQEVLLLLTYLSPTSLPGTHQKRPSSLLPVFLPKICGSCDGFLVLGGSNRGSPPTTEVWKTWMEKGR